MELRHLRYFVAVAEALHFRRAAEKLGIQQPPLSMQIRQLEAEIGSPLFRRSQRRVELTDAGRSFLEDARAILAQAQAAAGRARRAAQGELGRLRVGMINSAPFHPVILRILREYRERHPAVSMTLEESSTPELAERIRAQALDLAFVRPLLDEAPGLASEHLFDEPLVLALPQHHPLARRKRLPLAALSLEPFVLFSRPVGSGLYDQIVSACHRAGFSPRVTQEASQVTSIVNLVAAGLGVSVVPSSMRKIHSEGIVFRALEDDHAAAQMSMVWRRSDSSATVRNLRALAITISRASGHG
ncbi:MAG: LysR family transcriptional regulator [Panacagrimonas sp.]|jgi:DNA-binding transcriptional LysR family regulator|nr:LysR family transcriptional regulator [Panacagrimonas sp.]MCC2657112.1 LysR family transcriptional regulator [Panacagrimonas sp.]